MPQNYQSVIERQFPNDERLGFYVKPNLPANKLGRVLNDFTSVAPGDVVAFHLYGGMLGGGSIALTATAVHYGKAFFWIEDIQSADAQGKTLAVDVNQNGSIVRHELKADSDEAAKILARTLDTLATQAKAADITPAADYAAQGFSKEAVQWLEIRDEVLRTVDLLHDRFQAGKLSLLEYEEKKAELLGRL